MELTRWEHTAVPPLAALLEDDRAAFTVLGHILTGKLGAPSKVVSDQSRLILAYTCPPYPGWVWIPTDADEGEKSRAWALLRQELPPEKGFCCNVRGELAAYIMGTPEGRALRVHRRLNTYSCDRAAAPRKAAEGEFRAVGPEMLALAAAWSQAMSEEENLDLRPLAAHTEEIDEFIRNKRLFMWMTPQGEPAAMCAVTTEEGLGCVSRVYTAPEHRRRGYAAQLVYGVTKALNAQGMQAALYADANYLPSNACYQQIGYQKRGELCTIGM